MKAKTHVVIDEVYHEDEGNVAFAGSLQECEEFLAQQGFGYRITHMSPQELRIYNPQLTAKSGRFYRSIPDDLDVETWDAMTPADRLNHMGLIIEKENTDPL